MITFSHVYQKYNTKDETVPVYSDFCEVIQDGEFVVLTGESGSGKTTLLRMLMKEIEPDSGSINVDGQELSELKRREIPFYRRNIGMIFQDFRLIQQETVYDNLMMAILATGGSGRDGDSKISYVLAMLGIDHLHKRYPKELSGGEQQKVCLARAVINHPKILLADEPTGNLDPVSSAELIRLMEIINHRGTTIVMATHDHQANRIKDRRKIDLDQIRAVAS